MNQPPQAPRASPGVGAPGARRCGQGPPAHGSERGVGSRGEQRDREGGNTERQREGVTAASLGTEGLPFGVVAVPTTGGTCLCPGAGQWGPEPHQNLSAHTRLETQPGCPGCPSEPPAAEKEARGRVWGCCWRGSRENKNLSAGQRRPWVELGRDGSPPTVSIIPCRPTLDTRVSSVSRHMLRAHSSGPGVACKSTGSARQGPRGSAGHPVCLEPGPRGQGGNTGQA